MIVFRVLSAYTSVYSRFGCVCLGYWNRYVRVNILLIGVSFLLGFLVNLSLDRHRGVVLDTSVGSIRLADLSRGVGRSSVVIYYHLLWLLDILNTVILSTWLIRCHIVRHDLCQWSVTFPAWLRTLHYLNGNRAPQFNWDRSMAMIGVNDSRSLNKWHLICTFG